MVQMRVIGREDQHGAGDGKIRRAALLGNGVPRQFHDIPAQAHEVAQKRGA
jgi:hypothetical protein